MTRNFVSLMTVYTAGVAEFCVSSPKCMKLPTWFTQIRWCGPVCYMLTPSDRFSHKGTLVCILPCCTLTMSDASELIIYTLAFAIIELN